VKRLENIQFYVFALDMKYLTAEVGNCDEIDGFCLEEFFFSIE
jgi:hypothetical protein